MTLLEIEKMKNGIDNLKYIIKKLTKNKIFYWVDQGTLLGLVRENNILPWDTDIDISVWANDFKKVLLLEEEFTLDGYYFEYQADYDAIFLSKGADFYIEIAKQATDGDFVFRYNSLPQKSKLALFFKFFLKLFPEKIHFPIRDFLRKRSSNDLLLSKTPLHFFQDFSVADFNNIKSVNIPSKSREYLLFKYGQNWETPNQKWAYEESDGSVILGRQDD